MSDACEQSALIETVSIVDFEAEMTTPTWFASNDGTPGVIITPAAPMRSALEAPKCASDAAAGFGFHVVATGFRSWGYSFGFNNLNALPGAGGATYFDATDWTGISMWVRKGSGPSSSSIFAAVADRYTDPSAASLFTGSDVDLLLDPAQCPPASNGAACYCNFDAVDVDGAMDESGMTATDPLLSQCDKFGAGIGISTEWRFFKVPFSRMNQRAYGRPSAQPQPDAAILGLDISLDGENWDFWIDDISFYREPTEG